ncbi:hypothetical protein CPC08DRAFT_503624 [Agrocybe pediades]|nr:hypothetical protein CPC08DRAFT_503624 [Agrocybe pediades]
MRLRDFRVQFPVDHIQQSQKFKQSILRVFRNYHNLLLVHRKSADWVHHARHAESGSTALLAAIDFQSFIVTCSNAGDCCLVAFHAGGRHATYHFKQKTSI